MTWTYTSDPLNVPLDYIRLRITDTNPDDPLLSDQDIQALTAGITNPVYAAFCCAAQISANYAREIDQVVGQTNEKLSQLGEHFSQLMMMLYQEATLSAKPCRTQPEFNAAFKRGMMRDLGPDF